MTFWVILLDNKQVNKVTNATKIITLAGVIIHYDYERNITERKESASTN